jgi:acetyl-CoA carboxylase/biotin carboxylase 1
MLLKLEDIIRSTIDAAKAKGDGHEFPAVHMRKIMERYVKDNAVLL